MKAKFGLFLMFMMTVFLSFGQGIVKGTVIDGTANETMPGANVIIKGTSIGATTDFDGNFQLETDKSSGVLEVSFIGYNTKTISFTVSGTKNLGKIVISSDAQALDDVVFIGVADVAKERETPVAVSTIKGAEIEEKLGSQEFPEVLKSTPSVYVSKTGGGFGDARINIRGFSQENVAVLINGVPVNDMENGRVYWSNWAGLSDVTTAMQVQRGLGASKLSISSVGGTVNILTRTAEAKKGGKIMYSAGNDGYVKGLVSYSTGLMDNGLSASVVFSRTQGDGYADGTKFVGHNYFVGLGYRPNDNHNLQFTITGAPQWHHQRYSDKLSSFLKYGSDGVNPNIKYGNNWGYRDGKEYSFRRNFYHKPVASLNWDWIISDASKLSSVLYGSWGRGGGSGPIGSRAKKNSDGIYDFDALVTANKGVTGDRRNGYFRRNSMNSHNWYGTLINFNHDINENLSFDFGIDLRSYKGYHYRTLGDLLGADGYTDNRDNNNPNRVITELYDADPVINPFENIKDQQKIEYFNTGFVKWAGLFGQIEYKKDKISTFLQGGYSKQGFKRRDDFNLTSDKESDYEVLDGYNVKGGANYNIDDNNNVFVNAGYYSKQPFFSTVFPNYNNNDVNKNLKNEKVLGLELGYGFKSDEGGFKANVNLYRTSWKDRYLSVNQTFDNGLRGIARIDGVEEIHSGVEVDFIAAISDKLKLTGSGSIGDWGYAGDVTSDFRNENGEPVLDANGNPEQKVLYLDGVKVGESAQFTTSLGLVYKPVEGLKFDMDWRGVHNLYAKIDAKDFDKRNHKGSLKLPYHDLVDAGVSYKLALSKDEDSNHAIKFRFSINNLFDRRYISDSDTNIHADGSNPTWNGVDTRNRVNFGYGRTWNTAITYTF